MFDFINYNINNLKYENVFQFTAFLCFMLIVLTIFHFLKKNKYKLLHKNKLITALIFFIIPLIIELFSDFILCIVDKQNIIFVILLAFLCLFSFILLSSYSKLLFRKRDRDIIFKPNSFSLDLIKNEVDYFKLQIDKAFGIKTKNNYLIIIKNILTTIYKTIRFPIYFYTHIISYFSSIFLPMIISFLIINTIFEFIWHGVLNKKLPEFIIFFTVFSSAIIIPVIILMIYDYKLAPHKIREKYKKDLHMGESIILNKTLQYLILFMFSFFTISMIFIEQTFKFNFKFVTLIKSIFLKNNNLYSIEMIILHIFIYSIIYLNVYQLYSQITGNRTLEDL